MSVMPLNIATGLGNAFAALESALATPDSFTILLSRLGWQVQLNDDQMSVIDSVLAVGDDLANLADALADLESDQSEEHSAAIVLAVADLITTLEDLATRPLGDLTALPAPLNEEDFWTEQFVFPLIDLLLADLILDHAGALHGIMNALGFIEPDVSQGELWYASPYRLRWDRVLPAVTDPVGHLKTIYGWGGDLQSMGIAEAVGALARGLNLTARQAMLPDTLKTRFYPDTPVYACPRVTELVVIDTGITRAGLHILPVHTEAESGLYIGPFAVGNAAADVTLLPGLDLTSSGSAEAEGFGLFVQPDLPLETVGAAVTLDQEFTLTWQPEVPVVLIGNPTAARLELVDAEIGLTFKGNVAHPEVEIAIGGHKTGLRLMLDSADNDAFLNELLQDTTLNNEFSLRLIWSSQDGLRVEGSTGFEIIIPLNADLFFVTLYELYIALTLGSDSIDLTGALSFSAALPPFTFSANRIGLTASVMPDEDSRTTGFGGLDIDLKPKPPDGVGVGFNFLDLVYGGGFIDYFPDTGEYSGIIAVEIVTLGITATAIITTKPPDNPDGWSLFVSINVDLGSLPLGFGFTLEKVGGLVGVHRAIDVDEFQAGIRTGILDSILFPDDPIADAARILSDINAAFPTAQGSFVVGAMLQIGWGTPTLITGSLGFIVQVPDIIIALIGQAEAVLPFDDEALIEIHFDVVGILDLTAGTLSIDAGLRDSQIVGFVLTGQMAMRASYLTEPSFLLSMGGFHPAFSPPDTFPILDRLGFGLSVGDWLNISLEAYLALTSNTVQFGAGMYLTASLAGFRIEGGTEINTLIYFKPFEFRADLSYYITVSAASIELMGVLLTGTISGPNPYFVSGTARFKLLGLEQEVNIEETIGNKTPLDEVDDVPVLNDVTAAIEDVQSWHAVDDGVRMGAVLLAESADTSERIMVHPGGSVEVVQRVAPLDVTLEHYGNSEITGEDTLHVTDVKAGTTDVGWQFVEDWFALAQFFDMSESTKLSSPSFEKMKGGLRVGDDESDGGESADTVYDYKQVIRDPEFEVPLLHIKRPFAPDTTIISSLRLQMVTKTDMQRLTSVRPTQTYELKPVQYAIVERESLKTSAEIPSQEMTYAEASQKIQSSNDVRATNQIVVPVSERQTS